MYIYKYIYIIEKHAKGTSIRAIVSPIPRAWEQKCKVSRFVGIDVQRGQHVALEVLQVTFAGVHTSGVECRKNKTMCRLSECLRASQNSNIGQVHTHFGAKSHPTPGALNELLDGISISVEFEPHPQPSYELNDPHQMIPSLPGSFASGRPKM